MMLTTGTSNSAQAKFDITHRCTQDNPDCAAAAFYSNTENLRPHGPGRRKK